MTIASLIDTPSELTDTASDSGLLSLRRNTLSFQDSISKDLMTRAGAGDAASAIRAIGTKCFFMRR